MADSKYANLPGIDTSSKDVYESGDLPEEDQGWKPEELNSSSVEVVQIGTQEAFDHFNQKYVSGDFNVKPSAGKTKGYSSLDQSETMLQKYHRLQIEVEALMQDASTIQGSKKSSENDKQGVPDLLGKIQNLELQLKSSNLKAFSEEEFSFDRSESVLNALSGPSSGGKDKQSSSATLKDGSYQVYLKPDDGQKQLKRISMLEQRLANLENVVGTSDGGQPAILAPHSKSLALHECVQLMETKLSLLDHEKLPEVDTRLQAILTKVNDINKALSKSDSAADANKKTAELYETVQNWKQVQSALPHILTRLKDTEALHKKAHDFSSSLAELESAQTQIIAQLDSSSTFQKELKEMFQKNIDIVESNVSQINKRLNDLNKSA